MSSYKYATFCASTHTKNMFLMLFIQLIQLKENGNIFFIGLLTKFLEVIIISVANFLLTC